MNQLPPKQQRFCQEYLLDLNATQASIRAGYSKTTASSQGERLLRNVEVQAEIQQLMKYRAERTQITADSLVERLYELASSNVFTVLVAIRNKSPDQLTESVQRAVKSIKFKRIEKDGKAIEEISITMHDKNQPLQALSRHMGLLMNDAEAIATLQTYGEVARTEDGFIFRYADAA